MNSLKRLLHPLLVLSLPVLAACAAGAGTPRADAIERGARLRCPAGHTLTCEANRIGRIFQGTFAKNTDKCACVPDNGRSLESPVIPTIRQ
ncbi:MAG TPA: hypothetical protein VFE85_05465 [Woeseiaceae bacterium]|nr:hypothetical protein [Woeseiaceae bacterium]